MEPRAGQGRAGQPEAKSKACICRVSAVASDRVVRDHVRSRRSGSTPMLIETCGVRSSRHCGLQVAGICDSCPAAGVRSGRRWATGGWGYATVALELV